MADAVRAKGLTGRLILNGSFISQKVAPGDFDCVFVYDEASEEILQNDQEAQELISYNLCKMRWQGDIFTFAEATSRQFPHLLPQDMFDYQKITRTPKGVIEVEI